ncbi:MAG TPA: crossover junction endodeoxyribonuclease RuvC, partial [Promineifilum sp.]|nr:crossover junction endodeoxyribonuclease RuvC [Promineifilum sp.]
MRILGLDPGTATTGYGIIDAADGRLTIVAYGVISTPAGDAAPDRLQSIFHQLR